MRKLTIYTSSGERVEDGAELAAGTYYARCTPYDYEQCSQGSIEYQHDAAAVATLTVERTNQPDLALTAAGWHQISTTLLPAISIPGGSASGAIVDLVENCAGQQRVKLLVTTAGVIELWDHHKGG